MRRFKYTPPSYNISFWAEHLLRSGYQEVEKNQYSLVAGEEELCFCCFYPDEGLVTFNFYFPGMMMNEDYRLGNPQQFYKFLNDLNILEKKFDTTQENL